MADIEREESSTLISSGKVEGTSVYNEQGEKLGSIYNFMVDKRSGQVEYAVLQFGGVLGLGSDYYPLPWHLLEYDEDRGGYVIDIDKNALKGAPRYAANETPAFNEAYGEEVYGHYGLSSSGDVGATD
jgi:sporulation protein YlmC with PRC-barrel domain